MTRVVAALAAAALVVCAPARADDGLHAAVSAQGLFTSDGDAVESARLVGLVDGEVALGPTARLRGAAYVEGDARDRLEPGRPDQSNRAPASRRWLIGDGGAAELEELFVDVRAGGWSVRAGKQQTVWGTSDGIKVLDIVNPQSFREFILDDYERSRIPLWSLSAVRTLGERASLDLIVIPDLTFHDIPEPGAQFEITSPRLTPSRVLDDVEVLGAIATRLGVDSPEVAQVLATLEGLAPDRLHAALVDLVVPRIDERTVRPHLSADTVEAGARLRGTLGDVETAVCVLRHFDDVPKAELVLEDGRAVVTRRYVRSTSFGAQASVPAGPTLLRFEGVYGTRAPLPALDLPDDGLSAVAPSYGLVAAVDVPVRDVGLVSAQLGWLGTRTDAHDYDVPERGPFATALWRDEWIPNRFVAELFAAVSLDVGDAMLRARFAWLMSDDLRLQIGVDGFTGNRDGVFGQFDRQDRVGLELIWSV